MNVSLPATPHNRLGRMARAVLCAAVTGCLLAGAGIAQAATTDDSGHFTLSAGANYSSGKYGESTSTDIWTVPLTAGFESDRWTLRLTVPYIHVSGPADVIPGIGVTTNTNPRGRGHGRGTPGGSTSTPTTIVTSGSASGMGDVFASAGYAVILSDDHSFAVDVTGRVKFGTADENKGLGTGKNDYGVSLDTYKIVDNWTVFGGVGWTDFGSSQYIRLKNAYNANIGLAVKTGDQDEVGAYYDYREKIAVGGGPLSALTAYWNHDLGRNMRLQTYALGGFADGSPDYGVGISVKYIF